MQKTNGLIAAPFTPFGQDGELNLAVIEQYADFLVANGVSGALVGGTTGECGSLTFEERLKVTERWCEVTRGLENFPVFAHVGHSCLKESQMLAAQAEKVGASAVAALAPYYFKPNSVETLIAHCAGIAAAAPSLPFYYYHLPSITGVFTPVISILKALGDRIPNFGGVKFTYEDMNDFGMCFEFEDRHYDILCGRDEALLAGLALGAVGAVGSTYNYMSPIFLKMIKAFESGDMLTAQKAQEKVRQVIDVKLQFGGINAGKSIMRMVGVDCGNVRLPLPEMTDEKYEGFQKALDEIGFFEFCSRSTHNTLIA